MSKHDVHNTISRHMTSTIDINKLTNKQKKYQQTHALIESTEFCADSLQIIKNTQKHDEQYHGYILLASPYEGSLFFWPLREFSQ
jgi:hypothetical protein